MKPPGGKEPLLSALQGKKQEQRIAADEGGGGRYETGATTPIEEPDSSNSAFRSTLPPLIFDFHFALPVL
jgi:hypothetical protein